jgi:hypothetical protein
MRINGGFFIGLLAGIEQQPTGRCAQCQQFE